MFKITFDMQIDEHKWEKEGDLITIITISKWPVYRFPNKPNMKSYNEEDGADIESLGDYVDHEAREGDVDFSFPEGMKKRDQNIFKRAFENDGYDGLEELGWEDFDRETFVKGGFEIEEEKN